MDFNEKIYVAGHNGMVGSAIVRKLEKLKYSNIVVKSKSELDLLSQNETYDFLCSEKPDYVIIAAAKVGGIYANNTYPADFIYQNLMIESNLIHGSYLAGVKRLLFLGSSCIYPKYSEQPIKESSLLSGELEQTNEPYAIAKIAGLKICESYNRQYNTDYRSLMPTNLYGPNDNFDAKSAHVIPALIRKFHKSKINKESSVEVWGSGNQLREFLYIDDMADAAVYFLNLDKKKIDNVVDSSMSHINIGTGLKISIRDISELIKSVVGFSGQIVFNNEMLEGTYRKSLDVSKAEKLGWKYRHRLRESIEKTYSWFLENYKH